MTLALALFGHFSYEGFVSKDCFYPKPHVDSALLSYVSHEPWIPSSELREEFLSCFAYVYQHRRKAFFSLLAARYPSKREVIHEWMVNHVLTRTTRVDELDFKALIDLFMRIYRF